MALPSSQTAREWAAFSVVIGSRVYRAMLLTLVAIAVAPVAIGWGSYVIKSASMEPSISTGDVALGRTFVDDEKIAVGRVYMFDDPSTVEERILVHRIVEKLDDGNYVSAGDANGIPDSTPVTAEHMEARAVLLVPFVGLPITWLQSGQLVQLALWLLITMAAFFLATRNLDGEPPKWTLRRLLRERLRRTSAPAQSNEPGADDKERVLVRSAGPRRSSRGLRALVTTVAICLLGTTLGTANAAFSARTRNPDSTFTSASWMLPYVQAVTADRPQGFWLLDETTGTSVRDRTNTYANGTSTGPVTLGRPNAHTARNPGTSMGYDTGRTILHPTQMVGPETYSTELWFRTTSTAGGYLIGFENSTGPTSGIADRTLLMDTSGRLVVGDWAGRGGLRYDFTTAGRYNTGAWHHVVVAVEASDWLGRQYATLYVDGASVATGRVTQVGNTYPSQWRIGSGTARSRLSGGDLSHFRGDIDAVSIFDRALTPAQVKAHWDAR